MRFDPSTKDLELCRYCPSLCQSRCPVNLAIADITVNPCSKMSAVWRLSEGLVEASAKTTAPLHMCLDCLACREVCDHDVNVPDNLAAARLQQSEGYNRTHAPVDSSWDTDRAWQLLHEVAPEWRCVDDTSVLLVPGRELLQPDSIDQLVGVFETLEAMGDQLVGVNPHSVLESGHHAYYHGDKELARKQMSEAYRRYGRYRKVVIASPHHLSFVSLHWGEKGYDRTKVVTGLLTYLASLIDWTKSPRVDKKVAWHDPCHLGRHMNQYQVPTDLLKWSCRHRPIELLHSQDNALCCGGGDPLWTQSPNTAESIARMRLREFDQSDADVLVTGCSQCVRSFKAAQTDAPVIHIAQFLAEALK